MDETGADAATHPDLVSLGVDFPIWERFFHVAPLIVVGTKEPTGDFDLAPKHMAMPLGWGNYFAFVCTPEHSTYANAMREGAFTVSFPRPSQVVLASLAAAPRCDEGTKPLLPMLETFPAGVVDGVLLSDAYLHLECETHRVFDDFDENSLITGRIVAALVSEDAIRRSDRDDRYTVFRGPILAYVSPGRYAEISQTFAFPFHEGTTR
jgi:flavin reductase (DIM6/NTAB) family NADH-FMN oxidoreductase RutF